MIIKDEDSLLDVNNGIEIKKVDTTQIVITNTSGLEKTYRYPLNRDEVFEEMSDFYIKEQLKKKNKRFYLRDNK
jgi:hypothetical protein